MADSRATQVFPIPASAYYMGEPGTPVCSRENEGDQNGDMTRLLGDVGNLIADTTMKDKRGGTAGS
jgi:hypothetical protein